MRFSIGSYFRSDLRSLRDSKSVLYLRSHLRSRLSLTLWPFAFAGRTRKKKTRWTKRTRAPGTTCSWSGSSSKSWATTLCRARPRRSSRYRRQARAPFNRTRPSRALRAKGRATTTARVARPTTVWRTIPTSFSTCDRPPSPPASSRVPPRTTSTTSAASARFVVV